MFIVFMTFLHKFFILQAYRHINIVHYYKPIFLNHNLYWHC